MAQMERPDRKDQSGRLVPKALPELTGLMGLKALKANLGRPDLPVRLVLPDRKDRKER